MAPLPLIVRQSLELLVAASSPVESHKRADLIGDVSVASERRRHVVVLIKEKQKLSLQG